MRLAVLVGVSVLVSGCSHGIAGHPQPTVASASPPSQSATTSTATPSTPPRPGAPISEVIAWVQAAQPAYPAGYHRATREGVTTELGADVAFVTPSDASGASTCTTAGGTLTCLVDLAAPPPRPPDVYGEWKGNWVDFDGTSLQVGSAHGDPGPFLRGAGPPLPYGETLSFGDYGCRTDRSGLYCVNYAHRSAARFARPGIEPFGCLNPVRPPPEGGGIRFSC